MKEGVQEVMKEVEKIDPRVVVVIGIADDGAFVFDSTKDIANTAYMTDMAKAMMFKGQLG